MSLKGKGALVTGSSNGLGLAMATALASAGCDVVLHGLASAEDMQPVIERLTRQFDMKVSYMHADLSTVAGVDALMHDAMQRLDSLDVLINNAVVRHFESIDTFPLEHWNAALAVNLTAAMRTIQLVLPGMRARTWGRIFNMTSVYGARGVANRVDYVTTKTALLGLTRAVAMETLHAGITCNAICPGSVLTPNIDSRIDALMKERGLSRADAERVFLTGKQPTGELVEASHVADMVVFLCGASASQITGAMMPMEGGWLAS